MGTSKGYGGPASGLVPSWIDDVAPAAGGGDGLQDQTAQSGAPGLIDNNGTGALSTPRANFTRYARTGSSSQLGRALAGYVRNGTGGAGRAARRMGASRAVAGSLLGVISNFQQVGAAETLRRLDLTVRPGEPAETVFLAMLDVICPAGGAIDEAVARKAVVKTIGELQVEGDGSFLDLTQTDLQNFFLDFVANSIEGMVMADLGGRGVTVPEDAVAAQRVQKQLHQFIVGCTRSELSARLDQLPPPSGAEVNSVALDIYEAAFRLIAAAGEAAQ